MTSQETINTAKSVLVTGAGGGGKSLARAVKQSDVILFLRNPDSAIDYRIKSQKPDGFYRQFAKKSRWQHD